MRPLAAIVGGVSLAASFPPVGASWLAPIAVALLTLSTVTTPRVRGACGWGMVGGLAFFLVLLAWIDVLGPDAWLLLATYCALWLAALGAVNRVLRRLPAWPVWMAAAWVAQEALRDRVPYGGFPWGRLAFSQAESPALGLASVLGAAGVSFAVALSGAMLCWVALRLVPAGTRSALDFADNSGSTPPTWRGSVGIVAVLAVGVWAVGAIIPRPTTGEDAAGPGTATVALVQGSVPGYGLDAMSQRRAVLNNHVNETKVLAADVRAGKVPAPQLVIWPENSTDIDPLADQLAGAAITDAANDIGVPILVGAVVNNPTVPGTLWNVGIVWNPKTGPSQYYVKRHPVPFGEYLPGRSLLSRFISRFDRVPYDFAGGNEPGVLQVGPAELADVICFEIAYDEVVRDAVLAGGRAISVQTNNATYTHAGFGGAAQSEQQAAMSQIRAVEHGRAVLIAATSGVTAIINPAGEVVAQAPVLEPGYLVDEVPLRDSITIADRVGAWPEWLLFLAVLFGVTLSVVQHRKSSRLEGEQTDDSDDDSLPTER